MNMDVVSPGRLSDHRSTDLAEVVGQQTPTDPTLHPGFAAVAAAIETESPFQHADATFNAGSPTVGSAERSPLAVMALCRIERSLSR
jgi:hypothetical protein